ncbi:LysR family transcriptional regulator [Paenibacillus sp. NPDC058174]|uniref:LysR family transcriptional regulator n=1 Tax=Paenibacillus sp. NPDC058174 TaxID=3346366 RepID=UPI0036DACB31
MDINLEWYRCFYWVAKTGSLTKAAAHLHITQPAVSQTIKQLEDKLGGPLFFRTSKGVHLTAEGEVLFRYINQAFHHVELGENAIAEMHDLNSGEIHIGASDTLCKHYLLPYLERYHKQYPNIRIHVTNRTTPETLLLIKEGAIDFGIVNLPVSDKQIDIRESSSIQDCLVGGREFSHLAGSTLPLTSIQQYPLLLLEQGGSTRKYVDDFFASNQMTITPEFELGSIDLLVQFAVRGFGLSFVIRDFITEELNAGELVEIQLDPPLPERHIGIATLRGVPLSAASKSFLALLP